MDGFALKTRLATRHRRCDTRPRRLLLLDAEALLQAAAARTRQLLPVTYPRDRGYVRTLIALQNFLRRLKGNGFRSFARPPQQMSATFGAAGIARAARRQTLVWVLDLYRRS